MMSEAAPPTIVIMYAVANAWLCTASRFANRSRSAPSISCTLARIRSIAVLPAVELSKARASSRISNFAIRAIARSANPERHFLANSFSSSSRLCWAGLSELRLCWAGLSEVRSFIFWNAAA
jgi:hypothetical protein